MKVANKTHYYNETTKVYNEVLDPTSFGYQSSRRMGVYQRLWFEFQYTLSVDGIGFYYTFTYNNKSIPQYLGDDCFSYEHIRLITNGVISKRLARDYGARLKYCVVCESGEGKGKRGLGHNPHYHVAFFVQPIHDKDNKPVFNGYKKITPQEFRSLCYTMWQGTDKYIDWRAARFGHCQEGDCMGVIQNTNCFRYLGKYLTKGGSELALDKKVRDHFKLECKEKGYTLEFLYQYYLHLKFAGKMRYKKMFYCAYGLERYWQLRKLRCPVQRVDNKIVRNYSVYTYDDFFKELGKDFLDKYYFHKLEQYFIDVYISVYVESRFRDYQNKYSGKMRCSKSLGEYGLNFIHNVDSNPHFVIPNQRKGPEFQYPCLYYLRKLFYDYTICPYTGNVLYFLNDLGKEVKLKRLEPSLKSYMNKTKEAISLCIDNKIDLHYLPDPSSFVDDFLRTDGVSDFKCVDFTAFKQLHVDFLHQFRIDSDLLFKYAVYHCVYQYRSFSSVAHLSISDKFFLDDIKKDYKLFLSYSVFNLDFEGCVLSEVHYRPYVKSFSSHHLFRDYIPLFDFLDYLVDVASFYLSDIKKYNFAQTAEESRRIKQYQYEVADCC